MAKNPRDSSKVVSLQERRARKELKDLLKSAKPIKPEINLIGRKAQFSFHIMGGKKGSKIGVVIHDVTDGYANAVGVLRITPEQWEDLRKMIDPALQAHLALVATNK